MSTIQMIPCLQMATIRKNAVKLIVIPLLSNNQYHKIFSSTYLCSLMCLLQALDLLELVDVISPCLCIFLLMHFLSPKLVLLTSSETNSVSLWERSSNCLYFICSCIGCLWSVYNKFIVNKMRLLWFLIMYCNSLQIRMIKGPDHPRWWGVNCRYGLYSHSYSLFQ